MVSPISGKGKRQRKKEKEKKKSKYNESQVVDEDWRLFSCILISEWRSSVYILIRFFFLLFLQLKHCRKLYEGYVPMKYKSYLKKMKKLEIINFGFLPAKIRKHIVLRVNANSIFPHCFPIDQESGEII